ncbi:MAG TPA: hypothetical protein VJC09_00870 [Candidatus Saccharimonadales bacterium]|nr:hypothetical protein [Candidatus Saccharimonadales bacterium]
MSQGIGAQIRSALEQEPFTGISPVLVERIGNLPEGRRFDIVQPLLGELAHRHYEDKKLVRLNGGDPGAVPLPDGYTDLLAVFPTRNVNEGFWPDQITDGK